jgi:hypothetical protein
MDEETRKNEGTDVDEGANLDLQRAALILQEARQKARQELIVKAPALFIIWGLVYLIGYGAIWLSVRGQRPYQAPSGLALTGLFVLALAALAVTASITSRARSGITGASGTRMFVYYMSVGAGVLAVIILNAELAQDHASTHMLAFVGAAGPILVVGLAVSALGAVMRRWPYLALGVWLIAAAAVSGFAGPAAVWGILSLAVSTGFLGSAAVQIALRRS